MHFTQPWLAQLGLCAYRRGTSRPRERNIP
nr:MAG TPA: hypothetical protein [Caudoviricetes sp.]